MLLDAVSSICSLHTCNPQIAHWGVISLLPWPLGWPVSNPHHKANKCCRAQCAFHFKPQPLCAPVRPGARRAPVSARLWIWVTIFELEHMDTKVLQFTNSSRPGWSVYSGFFLQHPTEAPTEKQHQLIQAIKWHQYCMSLNFWGYYSYGGHLCLVHAMYNSYAHKYIPFGYHSLFGIQIFQQLNTIL